LRIALLTREFLPETRWGGIGTFYHDLAGQLRDLGHTVEVFSQGLAPPNSPSQSSWLEDEGVRVHTCLPRWYGVGPRRGGELAGIPARHLGVFAVALAREVAGAFERRHAETPFDVLESHEHLGIGAFVSGAVPHVVRYHTAYHVLVDRGLELWPRSRLIRWLEGRALRRATLTIAPTRFIDRLTREHFSALPEADLQIPLSCRFPVATPAVLEGKERVVAFVGRLEERKQPITAARAFARVADRFPDWRFEIAGVDARDAKGASTADACREILGGASADFRYLGKLESREIEALYDRAAIALLPSTFESFGLVALEAMSRGCVPVVTSGNALEEVVGDAGFSASVGDVDALAKHLERLMGNESLRLDLAGRALARSGETFDRSRILERNIKAYESVAVAGGKDAAS